MGFFDRQGKQAQGVVNRASAGVKYKKQIIKKGISNARTSLKNKFKSTMYWSKKGEYSFLANAIYTGGGYRKLKDFKDGTPFFAKVDDPEGGGLVYKDYMIGGTEQMTIKRDNMIGTFNGFERDQGPEGGYKSIDYNPLLKNPVNVNTIVLGMKRKSGYNGYNSEQLSDLIKTLANPEYVFKLPSNKVNFRNLLTTIENIAHVENTSKLGGNDSSLVKLTNTVSGVQIPVTSVTESAVEGGRAGITARNKRYAILATNIIEKPEVNIADLSTLIQTLNPEDMKSLVDLLKTSQILTKMQAKYQNVAKAKNATAEQKVEASAKVVEAAEGVTQAATKVNNSKSIPPELKESAEQVAAAATVAGTNAAQESTQAVVASQPGGETMVAVPNENAAKAKSLENILKMTGLKKNELIAITKV